MYNNDNLHPHNVNIIGPARSPTARRLSQILQRYAYRGSVRKGKQSLIFEVMIGSQPDEDN